METMTSRPLYQWETVCRLCLLEDGIKLPIFEEEGKQRRVSFKIQACFPIVIYETDPLPKMICHKCLFKLETIFEFRLRCLDVNSILLKQLELYGNDDNVQKYCTALREYFNSQDSCKQVPDKRKNNEEHYIALPEVKSGIVTTVKYLMKSDHQIKQDETRLTACDDPKKAFLNEAIIGARMTRSGNVSGDAASDRNAATVFQEVFLDEASSDGFFPEQPNGDCILQSHDMLAINADSAVQKKVGVEKTPPILSAEMIKEEPGALEENPLSSQFHTVETVTQPVYAAPTVDSDSQNTGPATADLVSTKTFWCKTCHFKSSDELEMREHLCSFQTSYPCNICSCYFYSKASFRKHQLRGTCVQSFKTCPQCSERFKSLEALAMHQAAHFKVIACTKEEDLHPCDCGMRFVCKLMLDSHRKAHNVLHGESLQVGDNECVYKCEVCGKGFSSPDLRKRHKRVHNFHKRFQRGTGRKSPDTVFNCKICSKVFTHLGSFASHSRIHDRPWKCKVCPSSFFRCSELKKHSRIHTKIDECSFSSVRQKQDSNANATGLHIEKRVFSEEKVPSNVLPENETESSCDMVNQSCQKLPFMNNSKSPTHKCKQCNLVLSCRSAWLIHRKHHRFTTSKVKKLSKLTGVKNVAEVVSYNIRSKVLTSDAEMAAHVQIRSGENVVGSSTAHPIIGIFQCSICGKSFSSKEAKLRHQAIHDMSRHKCFPCKICDKKMLTGEALAAHMKVHKNVSCDTCCKMFENDQALKVHTCSVGNNETLPTFKCSLCPSVYTSVNARNGHMNTHRTSARASNRGATSNMVSEALQPVDVNLSNKKYVLFKTRYGYKCSICGRRTATLNRGRAHMKLHLSKRKEKFNKFKCPFCSRGFFSINATYNHMTVNHPDYNIH